MERDRWGRQVRIRFGDHNLRMGGMVDLLFFAPGMSILDVGCNRGLMCYQFAQAGARLVHGCDYYAKGIETCREWFADINVQSRFECIDLSKGKRELYVFGSGQYDLVMLSAVIHKLRRQMPPDLLAELVRHFGHIATKYVAARVADEDRELIETELQGHFELAHWSILDPTLGQCIVMRRLQPRLLPNPGDDNGA